MRYCVCNVWYTLVFSCEETLAVVYILLCLYSDSFHCFYRINRICACGGFARKHNCACAVIDGICNVCRFRSCRAGILYHRVKHLGSGYYLLACVVTLVDKLFLDSGYLNKRNLYAHISSCHHYTVCNTENIVDIVNTVLVFNLCDYAYILAAVLVKQLSYLYYIFVTGYKACRNYIKPCLYAEKQIALVTLAEIWH